MARARPVRQTKSFVKGVALSTGARADSNHLLDRGDAMQTEPILKLSLLYDAVLLAKERVAGCFHTRGVGRTCVLGCTCISSACG